MSIDPWVPVFYESAAFGLRDWITIGVGVGGTLLGAVTGGWISSRQAKSDRAHQEQQEAKAKIARDKALLVKAQFQASLILADVEATVAAIDASLAETAEAGLSEAPLFNRIMPIVGLMTTPPTDIETIGPLIDAKENGLVQDYFELHAKHEVLTQSLKRFDQMKEDLNERVSPFMAWHEGLVQVEMNPEREAQLKPFFNSADSLAKQIHAMALETKRLARATTYGIGPAAQRIYKDDEFPILVPNDPALSRKEHG
jgi:hypothetical protein